MEVEQAVTYTQEYLSSLSRKEIQDLCKNHSIKANLKTSELVDLLLNLNETEITATEANHNADLVSEVDIDESQGFIFFVDMY
jgi:hypothetical protein